MLVWTDAGILLQSTMNGCNERYYEVRDLSIKNGLADDQICHYPTVAAKMPCLVRKVAGELTKWERLRERVELPPLSLTIHQNYYDYE